jgi:hypothetical protein
VGEESFEIGSRKFSLTKVDAFKQFHIVRRIGPILVDLLPVIGQFGKIKDIDKLPQEQQMDLMLKMAVPFMIGMSKLSDPDADYVLQGLLSSVQVQQVAGNWARVYANGMMMINDIELPLMFQLASKALMFNLSGFFAVLPQ